MGRLRGWGRVMIIAAACLAGTLTDVCARAQEAAGQPSDNKARNRAIKEKLKQKITLDFEDAPLEDILKFVKAASMGPGPSDPGIEFEPDKKDLKRLGVELTTRVSIRSEGKPLETSLLELLKPLKLDYTVEDGVVKIRARKPEAKKQ